MGLSIKVTDVTPVKDMTLLVTFENGVVKEYDTKQLLPKFSHYENLKDEAFFKQVKVECGGCAVGWNADIDISEVELWEGGTSVPAE